MNTAELIEYQPGDLVRCRGREWVVLPGTAGDIVRLRPLSGTESDSQIIDRTIELEPVVSALFDPPDIGRPGPQEAALLLADALRLAMRRGAGPFRSAGAIAFEPRAYQLVPLLMALKLDPVALDEYRRIGSPGRQAKGAWIYRQSSGCSAAGGSLQ